VHVTEPPAPIQVATADSPTGREVSVAIDERERSPAAAKVLASARDEEVCCKILVGSQPVLIAEDSLLCLRENKSYYSRRVLHVCQDVGNGGGRGAVRPKKPYKVCNDYAPVCLSVRTCGDDSAVVNECPWE
jgi:hypothetical protein